LADFLSFQDQQPTLEHLSQSQHDVFLIDGDWFLRWIRAMGVSVQAFSPPLRSIHQQTEQFIMSTLLSKDQDGNPSSGLQTPKWLDTRGLSCLVLSLSQDFSAQPGEALKMSKYEQSLLNPFAIRIDRDKLQIENDLVLKLDNSKLLLAHQRLCGLMELRGEESDGLIPMDLTDNDFARPKFKEGFTQYVALPFEVGRLLYNKYDNNSALLPAEVFKRKLRFYTNMGSMTFAISSDPEINSRLELDSKIEEETATERVLELFVHNYGLNNHGLFGEIVLGNQYKATQRAREADLDSMKDQVRTKQWNLPCYWATCSGIATVKPVESFSVCLRASPRFSTKEKRSREKYPEDAEWNVLEFILESNSSTNRTSLTNLMDVTVHEVLTKLVNGYDISEASDPSATCRMWGLFPARCFERCSFSTGTILPLTKDYFWIQLPLAVRFFSLFVPALGTNVQNASVAYHNASELLSVALSESAIQGLMIESVTQSAQWPCDALLSSSLFSVLCSERQGQGLSVDYQVVATTDDLVKSEAQVVDAKMGLLRVGLRVDVLTDDNTYSLLEISHIERDHNEEYLIKHSNDENEALRALRRVTITLRDPFLSSHAPTLLVPLILPLTSPRLFTSNAITNILMYTGDSRFDNSREKLAIQKDHEADDLFTTENPVLSVLSDSEYTYTLLNNSRIFVISDSSSGLLLLDTNPNRIVDEGETTAEMLQCVYISDGGEQGLQRVLNERGLTLSFFGNSIGMNSDIGSESASISMSMTNTLSTSMKRDTATDLSVTTAISAKSKVNKTISSPGANVSLIPRKVRMGIVGLANLGNTCFLSAALQCLFRCPFFTPYLLSYQYKKHINPKVRLNG
jgi:hypothetical protein